MEKLNKEDLISTYRELKAEDGIETSDTQARKDVDYFLESIIETLAKHKGATPDKKNVRARLQLVGFGSYELRNVPARPHRNPQDPTAEPKVKPAHNKVVLTLGKVFEESIN